MENKKKNINFFGSKFNEIILVFPERSRDILRLRYGISTDRQFTLEEIGQKYGITRERVRQIIKDTLKKIRNHEKKDRLECAKERIVLALKEKSGIIKEEDLIELLGGNIFSEFGAVRFFLDLFDEIISVEIPGKMKRAKAFADFDFEYWNSLEEIISGVIKKHGKPITDDALINKLLEQEIIIQKEKLENFLAVSSEIKKNNFGKWGIVHWEEITPRGTRDRAYLVLSEAGTPLHFLEIAKHIDMYKLGNKPAHFQTVHNELIKDERFVLIGRGIYALAEWGYKKGTVRDVLEKIFEEAKRPLSREDILTKVLTIRKVKKSTIIINLNNYFEKVGENNAYGPKRQI